VADSSILPVIPRANTNLTSMMIGHRAAQLLLAALSASAPACS
jgi:choline dehydrogenase-like flavoprotein